MDWHERVHALSDQELFDLCGYLYGFAAIADDDRERLEKRLLSGKRRNVFYLIDKNAYKTIRRLIRHPDRPVTYRYYPVDQLLELGMIESIPAWDNDEVHGWYQIRTEALDFATRVSRARHFDPLVKRMMKMDQCLLGLLHTYGMLELHQCAQMSMQYGITMEPQRLFAAVTWRLTLRDELQGLLVRQHGTAMAFILLRGLEFVPTYQGICRFPQYEYELIEEATLIQRKDRYYAQQLPKLQELTRYLRTAFSRKLVKAIITEFIDAYQYHVRQFPFMTMMQRVFDADELTRQLNEARQCLPDIYRKGHAPKDDDKELL